MFLAQKKSGFRMSKPSILNLLCFLILSALTCTAQNTADVKFLVVKNLDSTTVPLELGGMDKVPVFPKCGKFSTEEERKLCLAEKISRYVNKRFNHSLTRKLELEGLNKIEVKFQIDTSGNIVNIEAESNYLRLAEEAADVVARLPQMEPATKDGEVVPVSYFLPITIFVRKETRNPLIPASDY